MARMDHVMQIGQPAEATKVYLEDYVYTYLKRQENMEKKKYYLYGEREGSQALEKLYIYGISDSLKEENTYFKDYYPQGILKIQDGEKILVNRKGQEKHITGFFVFYAPNQAMQEYLVDTSAGGREEEKNESKPTRQFTGKRLPVREKIILPSNSFKRTKQKLDFGSLIFYAGCLAALLLLGTAVSGGNGYHKLAAFKQMVLQTMSLAEDKNSEEEFIVEEQRIGGEGLNDEAATEATPLSTAAAMDAQEMDAQEAGQETIPSHESAQTAMAAGDTSTTASEAEPAQEVISAQVPPVEASTAEGAKEEANYESYIVKEGDTLAKICRARYGSTEKMKEICDYNNIENEDYIAPGQKLYLP